MKRRTKSNKKFNNPFKRLNLFSDFNSFNAYIGKDKVITEQAKKDNNIIYGAQAIKKHIGMFARSTQDYDIFSNTPKRSATKLTKNLNRLAKRKDYYTKPAMHPGTYKVRNVGRDRIKNTEDDIDIADFTKPERKVKTQNIEGQKYVKLSEVIKDKKKSLADKMYEFRHAKDQEDLNRIKMARGKY